MRRYRAIAGTDCVRFVAEKATGVRLQSTLHDPELLLITCRSLPTKFNEI